jgi:hypothetical protein
MKTWREAIRDGMTTGSITSVVSTIALAACGLRETGTPYAATNAVSHWIWGDQAGQQDRPSARYTLVGYTIHHASATLWGILYEKWFGDKADRKEVGPALAGGAAVAGLACFVDYKMTPHRLQPGYEMRLSRQSLFLVYVAVGAGLALRGLTTSAHAHPAQLR